MSHNVLLDLPECPPNPYWVELEGLGYEVHGMHWDDIGHAWAAATDSFHGGSRVLAERRLDGTWKIHPGNPSLLPEWAWLLRGCFRDGN